MNKNFFNRCNNVYDLMILIAIFYDNFVIFIADSTVFYIDERQFYYRQDESRHYDTTAISFIDY